MTMLLGLIVDCKQKMQFEMRISDWSSDVCSSDLPGSDEMGVRVTGEMWWWRVAYLDDNGGEVVLDANELHIPVGEPVALELESNDVIHSFWVPRLSGRLDMVPGRRNVMRIQADKPGVYGGQCAEFLGGPPAPQGFVVVAHSPEQRCYGDEEV